MLITRLRRKTAEAHAELERLQSLARLMQGRMTVGGYAALLSAYAGHIRPLATVLDDGLRQTRFHWFVDPACRVALIEQDLRFFNRPWPPDYQDSMAWCELENPSFQVGVLYVHLGSRLGARLIARQLQASYGITAGNGGSYFSASDDSSMWPAFVKVLNSEAPQLEEQATVSGAQLAFKQLYKWLS